MVKLVSLVILVGLLIGSVEICADASPLLIQKSGQVITNPRGGGCACHCETDTASFRVWQQKDGAADLFAAKTISKTIYRPISEMPPRGSGMWQTRSELLILLGRSAKGIWTVETQVTDNEGAIYTDLVCTTIDGKHKRFPVVKRFDFQFDVGSRAEQVLRRRLNALVLRRLRQLAKRGQWDADSLIPVQLPLLSKPPALVFREQGNPDDEKYSWSLKVKAKNGRLVPITGDKSSGFLVCSFRAAKCFGGVIDGANGEIWWILVKTAATDTCGAGWCSIRLTNGAPAKH